MLQLSWRLLDMGKTDLSKANMGRDRLKAREKSSIIRDRRSTI